jgi:hypothetical protein
LSTVISRLSYKTASPTGAGVGVDVKVGSGVFVGRMVGALVSVAVGWGVFVAPISPPPLQARTTNTVIRKPSDCINLLSLFIINLPLYRNLLIV